MGHLRGKSGGHAWALTSPLGALRPCMSAMTSSGSKSARAPPRADARRTKPSSNFMVAGFSATESMPMRRSRFGNVGARVTHQGGLLFVVACV